MAYPEVVRVFATSQDPDFDGPWQARTPSNSTGSAVVIGKGLLLTGAHVVANATFMQIQKVSHPDKAIARVKAVSHDCDLALLEVVDPPNFLDDIEPAEVGEMPKLRDEVAVVGYRSAVRRSRSPRASCRASRSSATAIASATCSP